MFFKALNKEALFCAEDKPQCSIPWFNLSNHHFVSFHVIKVKKANFCAEIEKRWSAERLFSLSSSLFIIHILPPITTIKRVR